MFKDNTICDQRGKRRGHVCIKMVICVHFETARQLTKLALFHNKKKVTKIMVILAAIYDKNNEVRNKKQCSFCITATYFNHLKT